jgi:hypothetical protein
MGPIDLLLTWFSSRGQATYGVTRDTCLEIAKRFNFDTGSRDAIRRSRQRLLEPLIRLGHLEAREKGGWAITPPTLLLTGSEPKKGFFIGARRPDWVGLLERFDGLAFEKVEQEWGPERWHVTEVETGALDHLAASFELEVVPEGAITLLKALPSLSVALSKLPESRLPVEPMEEFRISSWRGRFHSNWEGTKSRTDGLFRMTGREYAGWYLSVGETVRSVPPGECRRLARWYCAIRQGCPPPSYDQESKTLWVPLFGAPLPVVLERALLMKSGLWPPLHKGGRVFSAITRTEAEEVTQILEIKSVKKYE